MRHSKASGSDGLNSYFYLKFWPIVGPDVVQAVLGILNGREFPSLFNHTHVIVIPKKQHCVKVGDFRPISLCNVLYKLVTMVIVNRLKACLPSIITENHSAFIPRRMIMDNILIAFEIFHDLKSHSRRNNGMALKLDMAKAFDRVEWPFLRAIMLKLGFRQDWVNLVICCVESVTFSFIINGEPRGYVKPSGGIRQGDSISPYLFLFCAKDLPYLLHDAIACHSLQGPTLGPNVPSLSHLLFVDESIIFCWCYC